MQTWALWVLGLDPASARPGPVGGERPEQCPGGPQPAGLPPAFLHFLFPSQPLRAVGSHRPPHADPSVTGSWGVSLGRASCSELSPACAHRTMLPPPFLTCSPVSPSEPCGPRQGARSPHEPVWWETHDYLQGRHLPRGWADGARQYPALPGPGQQLWSHPGRGGNAPAPGPPAGLASRKPPRPDGQASGHRVGWGWPRGWEAAFCSSPPSRIVCLRSLLVSRMPSVSCIPPMMGKSLPNRYSSLHNLGVALDSIPAGCCPFYGGRCRT